MMNRYLLVLLTLVLSQNALAHGENELGANNGFVRMPGNFHTELLLVDKKHAKIFLVETSGKNPMTKNSSVELSYIKGKVTSKTKCEASNEDFFICTLPKNFNPVKGQFDLKASRNGQVGSMISYKLPLKLE